MNRSTETTPTAVTVEPCDDEHDAHAPVRRPSRYNARAFDRAAALFRAAGDVERLRLLERLAEGEWCVSELAATSDDGLSTVSQRLRLLRQEGLVRRRRDGKHVYYSLADRHVAELIASALEHANEPDHTHDHHDHKEDDR
jgi:DNA-binding transcriptional ArsR family regulator